MRMIMHNEIELPIFMPIQTGERIKFYRQKSGLTVQALADLLFVSQQTIYAWQRGDKFPDYSNLGALAKVLGVSPGELLVYR